MASFSDNDTKYTYKLDWSCGVISHEDISLADTEYSKCKELIADFKENHRKGGCDDNTCEAVFTVLDLPTSGSTSEQQGTSGVFNLAIRTRAA